MDAALVTKCKGSTAEPAQAGGEDLCISAIIPTYHSACIVGDAIESVLTQSRAVDSIFVVDDGSGDDTAAVCARYAPRVTYLWQPNARASAARNRGIAAAVARHARIDPARHWLAFLDADDVWERDKIERQLEALARAPADFCVTATLAWSAGEQRYVRCGWDGPLDARRLRRALLVRNVLTGLCSSLLVRRDALLAVGGFATGKGSEDRRMGIELLARHRPLVLREALVRQRPGPAHWTDPERQRREMLSLMDDYAALYRQLSPSGLLRRRALARVHERSGMHYLENGDLRAAARDLARAVTLWPLMANPWRVLVNACLGRLKRPAWAAAGAEGRTQPA